MIIDPFFQQPKPVPFGHRRMIPRACIVDNKLHIRTFLADALEDLGFVTQGCGRARDVPAALDVVPDLIVLGLLAPESDVTQVLRALAASGFAGKVMLFGGRASNALLALHDLGEQLGLAMLPPLRTPFRDSDLHENLSTFLPIPLSPELPIDVEEALRNGWLELWYQPKIGLRDMSLRGAAAMVRMRHPTWGIVPPAGFLPGDEDPNFRAVSEFVIALALADWAHFAEGRKPIDMTIHLPMSILEAPDFIDQMCLQLPDHSAFAKLTVEVSSIDIGRDPMQAREAAKQLATYNVGISVDDVMSEASWVDVADFPIAELQVEPHFIKGCAGDRHKRAACDMVLKIAKQLSARTNAKGIETTADFQAVCDMGFDHGQGDLFAKPMEAHKFARTLLRRRPPK